MENESTGKKISSEDESHLNDVSSTGNVLADAMANALSAGSGLDVFEGLAESQSTKAISFEEEEIESLKKKQEEGGNLTPEETSKLKIHNIQSGRFSDFFTKTDSLSSENIDSSTINSIVNDMVKDGDEVESIPAVTELYKEEKDFNSKNLTGEILKSMDIDLEEKGIDLSINVKIDDDSSEINFGDIEDMF